MRLSGHDEQNPQERQDSQEPCEVISRPACQPQGLEGASEVSEEAGRSAGSPSSVAAAGGGEGDGTDALGMYSPFANSMRRMAPPSLVASRVTFGFTFARSAITNHRSLPCGTRRALVTGVLKCTVTRGL